MAEVRTVERALRDSGGLNHRQLAPDFARRLHNLEGATDSVSADARGARRQRPAQALWGERGAQRRGPEGRGGPARRVARAEWGGQVAAREDRVRARAADEREGARWW